MDYDDDVAVAGNVLVISSNMVVGDINLEVPNRNPAEAFSW